MRRSIHAVAVVAVLALTLAGCASGKDTGLSAGPTTPPPGETCTGAVDMVNLIFEPKDCKVPVGTKVTWVNKVGGLPHTVVSEEDKFESGTIAANGEFSFTFSTAGSYPYFCSLHATKGARAGMVGTIVVEPGSASGTASPSPTAT